MDHERSLSESILLSGISRRYFIKENKMVVRLSPDKQKVKATILAGKRADSYMVGE